MIVIAIVRGIDRQGMGGKGEGGMYRIESLTGTATDHKTRNLDVILVPHLYFDRPLTVPSLTAAYHTDP